MQVESRTQIKTSEDPVFVSLGKAGKKISLLYIEA